MRAAARSNGWVRRIAALTPLATAVLGFVGASVAAASHCHWPWYGRLIGGRFARHPAGTPQDTDGWRITRRDAKWHFHMGESDVLATSAEQQG